MDNNTEELQNVIKVSFVAFNKSHTEFFVNKTDEQIHKALTRINPEYKIIAKEEGFVSLQFASIDNLLKLKATK